MLHAFNRSTINNVSVPLADTVRGAKASMNLYSLIEMRKTNGVAPYAYLKHLFTAAAYAQTADHYEAILPWNVFARELSIGVPAE